MSQKPPKPQRDDADTVPPDALAGEDNDPTAPTGIPAVSRNIERAAEAALASMLVSYARPERLSGAENDRRTMPPPVPMEQLVEHMMLADSDRAPPPDGLAVISPSISDSIPPPGSDVDTVRTRMADMQRVPMSPVPASPAPPGLSQSDVPTVPPYPDNADTLPPANIDDDTEPGFRPPFARSELPPPPSFADQAIGAVEAVFEELGVELFRGHSSSKDVLPDEPTTSATGDDRNKVPEERRRSSPGARLTPTRTMRPVADAVPPSSSSGRNLGQRKRISETGMRVVDLPAVDKPPPSSRSSMSDRLAEVRERYESGDHRSALRIAETILAAQPDHLAALGYAESSRQMLRQKYLARIGDLNVVPHLKPVAIELARLGFNGRDIRVVDLIDGVLSVEDIVTATGLPTIDVLRVLHDLAADGLVEFSTATMGRR